MDVPPGHPGLIPVTQVSYWYYLYSVVI